MISIFPLFVPLLLEFGVPRYIKMFSTYNIKVHPEAILMVVYDPALLPAYGVKKIIMCSSSPKILCDFPMRLSRKKIHSPTRKIIYTRPKQCHVCRLFLLHSQSSSNILFDKCSFILGNYNVPLPIPSFFLS